MPLIFLPADEADAANSSLVQQLKGNVLRDMRVLRAPNAVTGQYSDYVEHVKVDNPKRNRLVKHADSVV